MTILDQIAHDYGGYVSALCRRLIMDEESAKDAAQHAWVEIVKSYPSFKGESKVTTWLYTIVKRVVIEYAVKERTYSTRHLREYFRADKEPEPFYAPGMDKEVWVRQMCNRCLTGILHCLEPEARLAYLFRDIADLAYSDIAVIIGKDEAAIRQVVTRGRNKLRAFLNNECYLYNPDGDCKCRMKRYVKDVNLQAEYDKLKRTSSLADLFKRSGKMLPEINYWKKIAI